MRLPLAPMRYIATRLGRVPSIVLLAAYLACIPVFAWIYQRLPNAFYHTTVRYEASFRENEAKVRDIIKRSILFSLRLKYGESLQLTPTVKVDSEDPIRIGEVRVDGLRFYTNIAMFFVGNPKFANAHIPLSFELLPFFTHKPHEFQHLTVELTDSAMSPVPVGQLFPYHAKHADRGGSFAVIKSVGFLLVSNRDLDELVSFANASYGFPSTASGSYGRMLYFSAVTITTLGFGDIVPITDQARAVTALEAVLGIVLAGLFLNSLAHEIGRSLTDRHSG